MRNSDRAGLGQVALLIVLGLISLIVPTRSEGATIWTGPTLSFTNYPGSDPTQPSSQDRMTTNVWITRGSSMGIYNAAQETFFNSTSSPADTEWADGAATNYSSLSFTDWYTWSHILHPKPPSTIGTNAVVHLISEDIYINIVFTGWGQHMVGGFSYNRSTPPIVPPSVAITNPAGGATFVAPATVTIQATASDSDGSVTNVQFLDGASSLGNVVASPYTVSPSLAIGSHTLTAVASDNLGATTTSAPVTIRVVPQQVLQKPALTNSNLTLSWSSFSGGTYRVQYKSDLNSVNWSNVVGDVTATGSTASKTDARTSSNRFYRVLLLP
jgi:hypothetical protein